MQSNHTIRTTITQDTQIEGFFNALFRVMSHFLRVTTFTYLSKFHVFTNNQKPRYCCSDVPQRTTSPIYTHHDNSISASFCPQNRSPLQVITRGSYINARRRSRSKRRCMKNPWGVRPSSRNLGQEQIRDQK